MEVLRCLAHAEVVIHRDGVVTATLVHRHFLATVSNSQVDVLAGLFCEFVDLDLARPVQVRLVADGLTHRNEAQAEPVVSIRLRDESLIFERREVGVDGPLRCIEHVTQFTERRFGLLLYRVQYLTRSLYGLDSTGASACRLSSIPLFLDGRVIVLVYQTVNQWRVSYVRFRHPSV